MFLEKALALAIHPLREGFLLSNNLTASEVLSSSTCWQLSPEAEIAVHGATHERTHEQAKPQSHVRPPSQPFFSELELDLLSN